MEFCVQDIVRNALLLEQLGQQLTLFNGYRTDQNRLTLGMALLNFCNRCTEFARFGAVYGIGIVFSCNLLVGRNLDDVQLINLAELIFLGQCRTGHTRQLAVHAEVVLERNRCQRLALALYLDMLLCLNRLMQTLVVASAEHQTAGVFIDNDNLAVTDDIVNVQLHDAVRTQRLIDVMCQRRVFRIRQIVHAEILLCLFLTNRRQHGGLCLFVNDIVCAQLFENLTILVRHRLCLFRIFLAFFFFQAQAIALCFQIQLVIGLLDAVALEAIDKALCALIHIGRLIALTGDNQRGTRLINQDGVHLIDDGKEMPALYHAVFVNRHVVTQIVKTKLVVCAVGNVCIVHRLALIRRNGMNNQSNRQAEEAVNLAHPLTISFCQIVVDGDNVHALARNGIQICRQRCHKRFAFTGFHFRNTALMQHNAADDLYAVMAHAEHAPCSLSHGGKCFRQQIIQRLAFLIALSEFVGLSAQLRVCQLLVFLLQRIDLVRNRTDALELMVTVCAKNLV